jgi:predicted DNA-binding transcriptional regulator YafY
VSQWNLLTNHGRVLLYIADDPEARLRDIAANLDITERSVYRVINEMSDAGYLVKEREGRRNRYEVQPRSPVQDPPVRGHSLADALRELAGYELHPGPPEPVIRRLAVVTDDPDGP